MSRIQLALNVDDVEQAVAFYTTLLGVGPVKTRPGYANFAVEQPPLKLVLLENPGSGGTLNHLGIEVGTVDAVDAEQTRLAEHGLASVDERGTTCCYAKQDKFWVQGAPDGERWEVYTVLADSQTFGETDDGPACCADATVTTDGTVTTDATATTDGTVTTDATATTDVAATPEPAAASCC